MATTIKSSNPKTTAFLRLEFGMGLLSCLFSSIGADCNCGLQSASFASILAQMTISLDIN